MEPILLYHNYTAKISRVYLNSIILISQNTKKSILYYKLMEAINAKILDSDKFPLALFQTTKNVIRNGCCKWCKSNFPLADSSEQQISS